MAFNLLGIMSSAIGIGEGLEAQKLEKAKALKKAEKEAMKKNKKVASSPAQAPVQQVEQTTVQQPVAPVQQPVAPVNKLVNKGGYGEKRVPSFKEMAQQKAMLESAQAKQQAEAQQQHNKTLRKRGKQ